MFRFGRGNNRRNQPAKVGIAAYVKVGSEWQRCWVVRVHDRGKHFEVSWGNNQADMLPMDRNLASQVYRALNRQPECRSVAICAYPG